MPNINYKKITRKASPGICAKCGSRIYWKNNFGGMVSYNRLDNKLHGLSCGFILKAKERLCKNE